MSESRGVEAVERALTILGAFDADSAPLPLAELARRTGYYKSTILRLAVSLEKFGYIVRLDGGRYRLGPSAWKLGATYRSTFELSDVLRPELKALSDLTRETASFYVREGRSRVCLYRSEPLREIRHSVEEGRPLPIETGASGKILLAFTEPDLPGFDAIRRDEVAISRGERDPDVAAVAVPLFAASGRFLGALSLSGLITRFQPAAVPGLADALADSRHRLEAQILS